MWHLLTLKGIFHLWDHSEIFLRSPWRLILSWSVIMELPIFVSSVKLEIKLFRPSLISFMQIMNRTGSRTEPYLTPLMTGTQSEAVALMTTLCFLLLSQFSIQLCTVPSIPSCLTLNINFLCGTLSNVFFLNQDAQYLKIWLCRGDVRGHYKTATN